MLKYVLLSVFVSSLTRCACEENSMWNVTHDLETESSFYRYCDFSNRYGPFCNMTGVDEELVVPRDFRQLGAVEIEIHNATSVRLFPVCLPWVQVFGVRSLVTPAMSGSSCRTWLRAYDSHLNILSFGVMDVSLVKTSVDLINLDDMRDFMAIISKIGIIQHLDWSGYTGIIMNTTIDTIISMQCRDNLTLLEVKIDQILANGFRFSGSKMRVSRSSFNHVFHQGIQIEDGIAQFHNVVFNTVEKYGIIVKDEGRLKMTNVSINICHAPCLVIPYAESVTLVNVSVAGVPIEAVEGAVKYTEDDYNLPLLWQDFILLSHAASSYCHMEGQQQMCDFASSQQDYFTNGRDDGYRSPLSIINAVSVHVINPCNLTLTLVNSTVTYTRHDNTTHVCTGSGSLNARNTTFIKMIVQELDFLNLTSCSIRDLHIKKVGQMELRNNSEVTVSRLTVHDRAIWQTSHMSLKQTKIKGEFQASNMNISAYSLEVCGLSSKGNISNSTVVSMGERGLLVAGELTLRNVRLLVDHHYGVYLTDVAILHLYNVTLSNMVVQRGISVAGLGQVFMEGEPLHSSSKYLYIRRAFPDEGALIPLEEGVFFASQNQSYCNTQVDYTADTTIAQNYQALTTTCNYTNTKDVHHVVLPRLSHAELHRIHIIGAQNVTFQQITYRVITLKNVKFSSMEECPGLCQYQLIGFNSGISNIINDVISVLLYHSVVGTMRPANTVDTCMLYNTTVETLETSCVTSIFDDSNIIQVNKMEVIRTVHIIDTVIQYIAREAFIVKGQAYIYRSHISNIEANGIRVEEGSMIMVNVSIDILSDGSIYVASGAQLTLHNVIIKEGNISSFNYTSDSNIYFRNVIMNNRMIKKMNSIQLQNLEKTSRNESMSTSVLPNTSQQHLSTTAWPINVTSPGAKTSSSGLTVLMDHKLVLDDGNNVALNQQERHVQPSTEPEHSWRMWAWAGAGIFVSLILLLAIICITIIVKDKRRGESSMTALNRFLHGLSRGRDEDGLGTELNVPSSRGDPGEAPGTHYVRLPSP